MIRLDRKEWIKRRFQIENREDKEKAIVEKLLPFLKNKKNIGLYIPIRGEVDVYKACKQQQIQNKTFKIFVPKVENDTEMNFYEDTNLEKGHFGILEPVENTGISPKELDVIVVPVVAFKKLHRVGYGKGYYDRYLKKTSALKIGVAFDCQKADFQSNPWDVLLDVMISENEVLEKKHEC